jgi:diketogulonate reductase-like aldo/keto reductase
MSVPHVPSLPLRHAAVPNMRMPQFGFGTYRLRKGDVIKPLSLALQAGYRMLDTAQVYDNEKQIGECLSTLPYSSEVFVTTKLWRSHQGVVHKLLVLVVIIFTGSKEIVKKNLQQSIKKLQRKYVFASRIG